MPYKGPERKKEWRREYKARTKAEGRYSRGDVNGQKRRARAKRHRRFAGVDGEGGNLPREDALFGETHEYLLLRAGVHVLETGLPLTTFECLSFIADLPRNLEHVSYYFDYDATMILRGLPPDRIKALFNARNAMAPTRWRNFEFRYLPHKELAVRRLNPDGTPAQDTYGVISDMGPFCQNSFHKTLCDWEIGTAAQRDSIAEGKARRADFGALTQETRDYNLLECELLVEFADKFADTCEDVGYVPKRWQGPGWLASSMLAAHCAVKRDEMPILRNKLFRSLANAAYYGGRFETFMVGPVPGPVFEYDINSAYPDAMTALPCMRHGTWVKKNMPREGTLWFGEVSFDHSAHARVCHLPIRTAKGGLVFPRKGRGVYWSVELEAAERAGTEYEIVGDCYQYVTTCRCEPFDWVPEEYRKRKALGGLMGKVIKLALNSLYGKLAQSIGTPTYANPVHASLITAMTRAKLVDAYRGHQDELVMVATDAVYLREPAQGLDTGGGLGQWEQEVHADGLFVVMPGVYFSGSGSVSKTRGISRAVFDEYQDDFRAAFNFWHDHRDIVSHIPEVEVKLNVFVTLKQANAWGKYELAGQWITSPRRVSMDWSSKRAADGARLDDAGFIRTMPQLGGEASVPYGKAIGGVWEQARLVLDGQPDWSGWWQPV